MKKTFGIVVLLGMLLLLAGCSCKHEATELRNAADATCVTDGYTGDTVCVECNEVVNQGQVVKADGHKLSEPMNARLADCYNSGYSGDIYCSFCGEMVVQGQNIPKLEHVPGDLQDAVEATCSNSGYTGDVRCVKCYSILEEGQWVEQLPHTAGEVRNTREATCTESGYTGDVYCAVCDDWMESGEYTDSAPHTPGEIINAREATCILEGYTGDSECVVCGDNISGEVIAKPEHDFVDNTCAGCGWMNAGLYINGVMEFTWDELKANSYVTVNEDNELTEVVKSLYGLLVVEDGVSTRSRYLFEECMLNGVYLPPSITEITDAMFYNSADLEQVRCFGPMTEVGYNSFEGCVSLKEFVIPEGVTAIRDRAFYGCASLKSIELPDELGYIGWNAFDGCASLNGVVLPESIKEICGYAFSNCASLAELVLPEGVEDIGRDFLAGSAVTELVLPASVKDIETQEYSGFVKVDMSASAITQLSSYGFAYSAVLEEVKLPLMLEKLPESVFSNCPNLKRLALPEGLTAIYDEYYDMSANESLTEIVWPVSLTDGSTLAALPSLETIYFRGNELQWNLTASKDLFSGKTIVFDYAGE